MESSINRFIWKYSLREQIAVLLLTVLTFPFLYLTLELPKIIINDALSGDPQPHDLLGMMTVGPVGYLLLLCLLLLVLLLIAGFLKMKVNTWKGILGERMLRRLRFQMLEQVFRFPMPQFQKQGQGEIIAMIASETEPLAGYIGDALALPAFQGGTMLTILAFMFVQDPTLGLAATALIPVQALIIPRLQKQVNALGKKRVLKVRRLSERIGESVAGIRDVRINGTVRYMLAGFSQQLGEIFAIRMAIYRKKFFMKGLNNFIGQMTPLLFYGIGGYQVLQGHLSIGALVAAVAAYKDLAAPWKEMLNFYQQMSDSRIKYDQLYEQFSPSDMLTSSLQETSDDQPIELGGGIELHNVSLQGGDGAAMFSNLSVTIEPGSTVVITGTDTGRRDKLVELLTRVTSPSSGRIMIDGHDIAELPESVLGPNFGYVGPDSYIFNGTVIDNVFFGLKNRPHGEDDALPELWSARPRDAAEGRRLWIEESRAAGNSTDPFGADWTDYERLGLVDKMEVLHWWLKVADVTGASETLFKFALDQVIDPDRSPAFAAKILGARQHVRQQLARRDMGALVRHFDYGQYNTYASVAENILFGNPRDERLTVERLATNDYCHQVFQRFGLEEPIQQIGFKLAEMLVEMFEGLPPGHPFYEQFSFVDEDTLLHLPQLLRQAQTKGRETLSVDDRNLLASLTFQLRLERHRLGLIDEAMQQKLIEARHYFHAHLPESLKGAVALFDVNDYNPTLSVRGNLLFGRVAFSTAGAEERVNELIDDVLTGLGIKEDVILSIRSVETGVAGSRMPAISRQRMSLGRALVKRPSILVANTPLQAASPEQRDLARRRIRELLPDVTIVWFDQAIADGRDVDRLFELRDGRLVELGEEVTAETPPVSIYGNEVPPDDAVYSDEQRAEVRLLAQVPIFANLPLPQLKLLAFTAQRLQFGPGDIFYRPGDVSDGVYVVVDGMVDMVRGIKGRENVVATLGPQGVIGELEVLSGIPRVALVRASSQVTALRIDPTVLINFVRNDSRLALAVIRGIGLRSLGRADEWRDSGTTPAEVSQDKKEV